MHDARAYEQVLRQGSVGLGESYADGWWDVDDLTAFLRVLLRSLRPGHDRRDRFHRRISPLVDPVLRLRRPDPARDARHVRAHYDLGNEFFARLLDETMAYSCAIFDRPGISLADASRAKFDRLARTLDLQPGDRLLEIGTGWAGFAIHVATNFGCQVTTTTVSELQFEHARAAVAAAGLTDRITVLDADYRDLRGTFDKAVAIEMIEAVDWRDYDAFFDHVRNVLTDDGAFAMQAIVAADESFDRLKRHSDFIKAAIFPGGLPAVGRRAHGVGPRPPRPSVSPTSTTSGGTMPRRCAAGGSTSTPRHRIWTTWGSTSASAGSGGSTWPTARRGSTSATSAPSSCSTPRPGSPRAPPCRGARRSCSARNDPGRMTRRQLAVTASPSGW